MDVTVASKYGNILSNLTCVIIDDVHSTIENFKTDLQNALPRQISEAQGKQPDLAHSTPYPGNTSAPGNMGTLFPGSTTAPGNTRVLANTSTPHTRVALRVTLFMLMLVHRIRGAQMT
jgi:hypothetical protein